jgi:hypothetical protein
MSKICNICYDNIGQKEGLYGFGFDFGNSKINNSLTSIKDTVNKTMMNTILSNTSKCQNSVNAAQIINIKCPPELLKIYNEDKKGCYELGALVGGKVSEISKACGEAVPYPCSVENVKQSQSVEFSGQCEVSNEMIDKMKEQFESEINRKINEDIDGVATSINDISKGLAKSSEILSQGASDAANTLLGSTLKAGATEQDNSKNIKESLINEYQKDLSVSNLTEMIGKFSARQELNIEGGYVKGITQNQRLKIVANLTSKNKFTKAVETVTKEVLKEDKKIKKKGLTDITGQAANIMKTYGLYILGGVAVLAILIYLLSGNENFTNQAFSLADNKL